MTKEDSSIRPFKVETAEEELSVSKSLCWGKGRKKWPNDVECLEVFFKLNQQSASDVQVLGEGIFQYFRR